jgi:hypothetical protein
MNTALITLLRAFYWVTVPIYLLMYALAMRGDMHAAFWIEGGNNDFGTYSFYALILCWIVPLTLGAILSVSGHKKVLVQCTKVALVLSTPCLPGFLFSTPGQPPMIVPHLADFFSNFWVGMLSVYGGFFFIFGIGIRFEEKVFPELDKIEFIEIIRSFKVDNEQLWAEHQELRRNHDGLKLLLNEFKSGGYTSSTEFFNLLLIAENIFNVCSATLPAINSKTISKLKDVLFEYRLGRFSSPSEYAHFKMKRCSDSLPQHTDEAARKITHPLLIKMYNSGDALRARAIEISNNNVVLTEPPSNRPPPPPTAAPTGNLAISRNGQVIMQDVPRQNVQSMIMQGTLLLTDHYWANGMSTWLPLSNLSNNQANPHPKSEERTLTSVLLSLFISWLITVVVGVIILGLIGYGNSGADGAGRLIGAYIGLLIFVRPIFLVIEVISRAITGKRGVDLLAP